LIEAVIDRKASVRNHKSFWKASEGIDAVIRTRGPGGMSLMFGGEETVAAAKSPLAA